MRKNDRILSIYSADDWKAFSPPTANKVIDNRNKYGDDQETKLTEWEKNLVLQLFKEYDKQKLTALLPEELYKICEDLENDKCNIGKVCVPTKKGYNEVIDTLEK